MASLFARIFGGHPRTAVSVLVYCTPYGRKSAEKEYTTFDHAVERGYAVLIQVMYVAAMIPAVNFVRTKTKATTASTRLNGQRGRVGPMETLAASGFPIPARCNGWRPLRILHI